MAFAGSNISKFKKHDGETHDAARTLAESAAREDGYAIIADFATLQNNCLMCHQRFRKSFVEHFLWCRLKVYLLLIPAGVYDSCLTLKYIFSVFSFFIFFAQTDIAFAG